MSQGKHCTTMHRMHRLVEPPSHHRWRLLKMALTVLVRVCETGGAGERFHALHLQSRTHREH